MRPALAEALFKNNDRVRVERNSVTHLRSGRKFALLDGASVSQLVRTRLINLHELADERIDLATQADPPIPGALKFVNAAATAGRAALLSELTSMPTSKSPQDRAARNLLFASMDGNGNGFLSLAEVDLGLVHVLSPQALAGAKPAVLRAFNAAKAVRKGGRPLGDDLIERGEEFRLFLLYTRRYLELFAAFEQLDTSGDRRLDVDEFEAACSSGLLSDWGVAVSDPVAEFAKIDLDKGGQVLFDEFAHWALTRHLHLDGDDTHEEPPMPAEPNLASAGAARAAAASAAAVRAASARPAYVDGGTNALTATLASAAMAAAADGTSTAPPRRARHGVIARVATIASTPTAPPPPPIAKRPESPCGPSVSVAPNAAAWQPPSSPKHAWGSPRPRNSAITPRVRAHAPPPPALAAGSGGAGQGPFRLIGSHQRVLFMIDQTVTGLDTHSRRLVGSHSFALVATKKAKRASTEGEEGEEEENGEEDDDENDDDDDEDEEEGTAAADDNSRLGDVRRLLLVAERINELASISLDKLSDGRRGGGGARRSSLGASSVSATHSSAVSRRSSQGGGGMSRASSGGGGALAPPFRAASTFTSEVDARLDGSRAPVRSADAGGALMAREGLASAYHAARRAGELLRAREAAVLELAEGCEQSIAALHALHRVYARAIADGSQPMGATAAGIAAAQAAAAAASVPREVRVVCSVDADSKELCLYRSESSATPYARLPAADAATSLGKGAARSVVEQDASSGRLYVDGEAAAPIISARTAEGNEVLFVNARRLFVTSARSRRAAAKAGSAPVDEWTEEEDGSLYHAIATNGMSSWSAVSEQVEGRRAHECELRWAAVLDEQLKEARLRQQQALKGGMDAERELTVLSSELMAARRRLGVASRHVAAHTAAMKKETQAAQRGVAGHTREARNATKVGAFDDGASAGVEAEIRVGTALLMLTNKPESVLKRANAPLIEDFSHLQLPQPAWMARQGVRSGATHHKLESLEGIDVAAVEAACTWRPGQATPLNVARFQRRARSAGGGDGSEDSEEEEDSDNEEEDTDALRAVDGAVRDIIGDRGAPFFAALDVHHVVQGVAGHAKLDDGAPRDAESWFVRFGSTAGRAGPQQWGDLLVLLVTSGELRLRLGGYCTLELQAGHVAIVPTRLWVHTLFHDGHVLALAYRAESPARTSLSRNPHTSMLVRAGHNPIAPGVSTWTAQRERLRAAETAKRESLGLRAPPTPWVHSNQPMRHKEEEVRREAKRVAAGDPKREKPKSKPPLPRQEPSSP